jgi:DNA polymerase-1
VIVNQSNFYEVIEELSKNKFLSFDTETNGLYPYNGSSLFSVVVSDENEDYYFDFNTGGLDRGLIKTFSKLFVGSDCIRFAHNAKFDLHFLSKEGVEIGDCKIHDTEVIARLLYNQHEKYTLAECAARIGLEKLGSEVEEWIEANNAFEEGTKRPMYERVPFELMYRYATRDSRITYQLGMHQLSQITEELKTAVDIEYGATIALFHMEQVGIKIDPDIAKKGFEYETKRMEGYKAELDKEFGKEFIDHADHIKEYFESRGFKVGVTPDGNPSAAAWVLEGIDHPVAKLILDYRDALKRRNTYWANILEYADKDFVIHPNFRQAGAMTLRTSCTSPNMQNQSKEDDSPIPLRSAFVPRDGYTFVEFDFAAQEFRLAVDYAKEYHLAEQIKNGFDPHTASAEITGLDRKKAKVMNFALLYGCGASKLAKMLNCSVDEAKLFKAKYFNKLPGIKNFIYRASEAAKTNGFVRNWAGVRYYFPDKNWAYKAANSVIQGGCAYISKNAMRLIDEFLKDKKSRMVLQVHDSILLEMPDSEFHLIPEIQSLMIKAYPHKIMPMGASVEWSRTNWSSLQKGMPSEGSQV